MTSAPDVLRLVHGSEIWKVLIMIEGEDGRFELRACGWLGETSVQGAPLAEVRGCAASAIPPLLGRSPERETR